ncbi:D-glycero-alpha-D-manno-heptose-1,7-bisphosphate 7-phosphatase [Acetivibrio cellulolyticus]|uniref:D-glycero-alpha-D-manno-heptose-1,7-bisphosphate 7-phosphatase n=1 Tax=Acetivibrio cellulolyticus TaxID=35830 RepID=UPI0001E2E347|nr:HAD family hydrolase [Acetivibrio cellulolyticus]
MNKVYPAVFLDRDGVVCKECGYITSVEQLEIYDFSVKAVAKLKERGYKCIIITNQSAVARGIISEIELKAIHRTLAERINIDDIYYCPHYPPDIKENPPYIVVCECRKPAPGMLLRAAKEHSIDLKSSYFVGDRSSDVLAGQAAGVKTVMVRTGYGAFGMEQQVIPDFTFDNLLEFAEFIC